MSTQGIPKMCFSIILIYPSVIAHTLTFSPRLLPLLSACARIETTNTRRKDASPLGFPLIVLAASLEVLHADPTAPLLGHPFFH